MGRLAMSAWVVLAACCVVNSMVAAREWGPVVSPEAEDDKPRRRKLLLHIGPHKTGTTAFQSWLRLNHGVSPTLRYPKVCGSEQVPAWYAHVATDLCESERSLPIPEAWAACPPNLETLSAAINDADSNPTDLVISSENFSKCSIDQYAMLKALFGQNVDMELVILRRESRSLMLSRYHQWHKTADPTETVTETFMQGDRREHFCSYTGMDCLRGLSDAFGPNHVHVFSYEGLLAAGKELSEALCDVFSNSTGCYAAPSKDQSAGYRPNTSHPHLEYSAALILSHFKTITGCRYTGEGIHALGRLVLSSFMEALEKADVPKYCFPLSHMPSAECDSCFFDAMLGKDETFSGINRYYFQEGAAYVAASTPEVCEYKESAIYESRERFKAVVKATRHFADSCPRDHEL